jgi:hypothetical protein
MLHHIKLLPFIGGVALGLFLFFFYTTPPLIIYEYPRPNMLDNRIYRDKNAMCYSYTSKEVNCDANESTLRPYPLQA